MKPLFLLPNQDRDLRGRRKCRKSVKFGQKFSIVPPSKLGLSAAVGWSVQPGSLVSVCVCVYKRECVCVCESEISHILCIQIFLCFLFVSKTQLTVSNVT